MKFFIIANLVISVIFTVCYSYQIVYMLISSFKKPKKTKASTFGKFAVLVSARDEETVISQFIDSVKKQNYPAELLDIYVLADNCTDNTAFVAKQAGAIVFERENKENIGKGYALNFLFRKIFETVGREFYDGYFIFDADNLLDENYVSEINNVFSEGYEIITSYRNSKNYDSSWVSAGYSLGFLRDARFLHNARMVVKSGSVVSGTGFLVSRDIINENGGWTFFTLCEDCEFSIKSMLEGHKIAYCHDAVFYDEQPIKFKDSLSQRLRWVKGTFIVFGKYGKDILKALFKKGRFVVFDVIMTSFPAMLLSMISILLCAASIVCALITQSPSLPGLIKNLLLTLGNMYLALFFMGLATGIAERKRIKSRRWKKLLYYFTFPIFMLSYIPICVVALFKRVTWRPTKHSVAVNINELQHKDSSREITLAKK